MGPVTRSSQHGRPLPSNAAPQPALEQTNDDPMPSSDEPDYGSDENSQNDDDPFNVDDGDEPNPPFSLNSSTAHDLLQPLQQTADRVSRQVEQFAKLIDKFNTHLKPSDQKLWEEAFSLVEQFGEITRRRTLQTGAESGRSRSSSRNRRSLGDSEAEIQKVEFEADLWYLTQHILFCNSPKSLADACEFRGVALDELHRYSTPPEIWNAFLNSDVISQEYEVVLDWLQETAAASPVSIDAVISELNVQAERGDGIWSAGYLYTKNAIKAQKRTRSWPKPLDPTNPGIKKSHTRAIDSRPLVTQMDPDARTREEHVLQPQDDFHEQAAWQACWELLRRGQTQEQSREWWKERKETWRAASLRGTCRPQKDHSPSPFSRIINLVTNSEWIERCRQLCRDGSDLYTYQSAVYGVLCGETNAVAKACKTIDDSLFSFFNASLIKRYESWILAYRRKLESSGSIVHSPPEPGWEHVRQFLSSCQRDEHTKAESHQAHKAIEAAIISKDFDAFLVRTGQAAAQVAHMNSEGDHLMEKDEESPVDTCAQVTAADFDSVRMVAHLQLLLKSLGYLQEPHERHLYTIENNIANYIGWLERENKFNIIPLYASKLSPARAAHVLGAVLINIVEPRERDLQVKLMKKYMISVPKVLWAIFGLANFTELEMLKNPGMPFNPAKITEYTGTARARNIKIRSQFIGEEIKEQDEVAVRSMEWFRYIDAENWGRACWAASALYMMFLYQGRLAAASALAERASLSDMSLAALNMNLNIAEASDDEDVEMDGVAQEETNKPISPSRRRKQPSQHLLLLPGTSREALASKSLVWVQLEQLVIVMNAFERWNETANEVDQNRNNPGLIRDMKKDLLSILYAIRETMYPLLEKDFLCKPNNEGEGRVMDDIRNHYLPECILAYNSVLYFAGHAISRSWLVDCMHLAQTVAANPTLTNAFVESKRMQELVTAFALDSQALLHANEAGGKKGKKDNRIDIWQIKGFTQQEPLDLEALD